jgi:hypothetical protein
MPNETISHIQKKKNNKQKKQDMVFIPKEINKQNKKINIKELKKKEREDFKNTVSRHIDHLENILHSNSTEIPREFNYYISTTLGFLSANKEYIIENYKEDHFCSFIYQTKNQQSYGHTKEIINGQCIEPYYPFINLFFKDEEQIKHWITLKGLNFSFCKGEPKRIIDKSKNCRTNYPPNEEQMVNFKKLLNEKRKKENSNNQIINKTSYSNQNTTGFLIINANVKENNLENKKQIENNMETVLNRAGGRARAGRGGGGKKKQTTTQTTTTATNNLESDLIINSTNNSFYDQNHITQNQENITNITTTTNNSYTNSFENSNQSKLNITSIVLGLFACFIIVFCAYQLNNFLKKKKKQTKIKTKKTLIMN